jgi:hypothetical protein
MRSILAIMVISAVLLPVLAAPSKPTQSPREKESTAPARSETARLNSVALQSSPGRQDDVQAMREDSKKMRVLVQQMQANLAFVDSGQTPLKHQFQLEIDMWRMQIAQLERRLQANAH